jgi:uncharacterized protein with NRDE domain
VNFNKESKYKLIAINNRDEFYARPTLDAFVWPESKELAPAIGGKDLERGGTWLAVSKKDTIKLGALLNITGSNQPNGLGRGSIVCDYLLNPEVSIKKYNEDLFAKNSDYSAFNFVSLELR